ncbi:MAG: pilus assembly protein PilM [Planctomycetota bacterium]
MSLMHWKGDDYSPIAIGIGSHFVHLVQLRLNAGEAFLQAAASTPVPVELDRAKALTAAIRACLSAADFKGRRAALCLKGEDLYIQHQRMVLDTKGDSENKIKEELRRNVSFKLDRAEIRFVATGRVYEQSTFRDELILMVADREIIDNHLAVLDGLNLSVCRIGAEPFGLMRSVLAFPPAEYSDEEVTGFLNIGASKTELVVIRDGHLVFSRSFPMGGEKFVNAISEKLELDTKSATRLKEGLSREEDINDTLKTAALSAVRPIVENLCSEILSCFRYYSSIFNRESVNRLIITGEEVGTIIVPEMLVDRLETPVHAWDPHVFFKPDRVLSMKKIFDSGFTPVIGIALDSSDLGVDFMPSDVKEKRRQKKSTLLRVTSSVIFIMAMVILFAITQQRRLKLNQMREMVVSRCNLVEIKNVEVESLSNEEIKLAEKRTILEKVRPEVRVSRIVAEVARASGKGIYLKTFSMNKTKLVKPRRNDGEAPQPDCDLFMVRINGLARTMEDLVAFEEQLGFSKAFSTHKLNSFEDIAVGKRVLISFSMTLTLGMEEEYEGL